MNLKELGLRIKDRREKQRLRQADIASVLRVSAQAVSKWERGENAPDIALLIDLARALDCSVEWLLTGGAPQEDTFPATIFCSSLNHFAEKAAALPPRKLAAWANAIYYTVTEAVLRFDGVPVKYVGDGSLAFFSGQDHATRALQAAVQARELLDTPGLVVVLHTGSVYLGTIGHPDYARPDILGETVNTAFLAMPWVSAHCQSGIGLTAAAREQISPAIAIDEAGEVQVPGIAEPLTMFEPKGDVSCN